MVCDSEIVEHGLESVLRCKAGVCKKALFAVPFRKATIIEGLHVVGDDEGNLAAGKALLEHNEPAYAAISVLEGMDSLEGYVEAENVVERVHCAGVVVAQKALDLFADVFGQGRLPSAHFVRQALVVADGEPIPRGVGGACLEYAVQFFDHPFGQGFLRVVDDVVDGTEVVLGFYDVVDSDGFAFDADGCRFEDEPCLIERQPASFDVVGVVGELDLDFVVDSAFCSRGLLLSQALEQGGGGGRFRVRPFGLRRSFRDIPRFPRKEGAWQQ